MYMDKETALTEITKLLDNPDQIFVLSTLTGDGYPDSRIMGNICEKKLDAFYFTCRTGTRKIEEILKNRRASVYFHSETATFWLYGSAGMICGAEIREKLWNDRIKALYRDGVNSPDLNVIRFVPVKLRILEKGRGYSEFQL